MADRRLIPSLIHDELMRWGVKEYVIEYDGAGHPRAVFMFERMRLKWGVPRENGCERHAIRNNLSQLRHHLRRMQQCQKQTHRSLPRPSGA